MVTIWNNTFVTKGNINTYYKTSLLFDNITIENIKENTPCLFVNIQYKKMFWGVFNKITGQQDNKIFFSATLEKEAKYEEIYTNKIGWYLYDSQTQENIEQKYSGNTTLSNRITKLKTILSSESEKNYLEEAIKCFNASAYHSSIIIFWILLTEFVYNYIFESHLNQFNKELN